MSQSKYTVFYGQQVYGEYEKTEVLAHVPDFPDGCYMRNARGVWYIRLGGGFTPINLCDIPPEVRVNCLLMGIPV